MAQNKKIMIGPVALTNTLTTNIYNPPTLTGGVVTGTTNANTYVIMTHIHISNKTASAATFSLWKGATGANAAGTEFLGTGFSVPANSAIDFYGQFRFDVADFLVGGSGTATALTFQADAEIGIA